MPNTGPSVKFETKIDPVSTVKMLLPKELDTIIAFVVVLPFVVTCCKLGVYEAVATYEAVTAKDDVKAYEDDNAWLAYEAVPCKLPVNPPVEIVDPVTSIPAWLTLNFLNHVLPLNSATLNPLSPPFLVSNTYSADPLWVTLE